MCRPAPPRRITPCSTRPGGTPAPWTTGGTPWTVCSGALQVQLPELAAPDRPLYAIHGPGPGTRRKITVFLDFLAQWFAENPIPTIGW
ncbi:hypothetical protein [Streptomyces sp. NPDC101776]|uniref:hypothetical protein n=1 Tax=Streptomyces sp. NPDC101776 TaxID=3366146 RepID=UPI003825DC3B